MRPEGFAERSLNPGQKQPSDLHLNKVKSLTISIYSSIFPHDFTLKNKVKTGSPAIQVVLELTM